MSLEQLTKENLLVMTPQQVCGFEKDLFGKIQEELKDNSAQKVTIDLTQQHPIGSLIKCMNLYLSLIKTQPLAVSKYLELKVPENTGEFNEMYVNFYYMCRFLK